MTSRVEADRVTLTVAGEIDLVSAAALDRELREAERAHRPRIILDFAALDFIDSTGLYLLIHAQWRAKARGHQLVLTHIPAHAKRLLELTGIGDQLVIE